MTAKPVIRWAALWRSKNRLDGNVEHLMFYNGQLLLFRTRKAARDWIEADWGYIRRRPDLKREPFGWRMPIPVRVSIKVQR